MHSLKSLCFIDLPDFFQHEMYLPEGGEDRFECSGWHEGRM